MESCLQLWPGRQMKAMACLWVTLLEGWMEAGGSLTLPLSPLLPEWCGRGIRPELGSLPPALPGRVTWQMGIMIPPLQGQRDD